MNFGLRLDEIVDDLVEGCEDGSNTLGYRYDLGSKAKQALTSLIKELVAEAEADIKLWVDDEVIGSDERHSNGKKMVNYWSCEDCGTPEEAWTRNQLRADQRKRLWLEKFEQNLLKELEGK
jgi:hypothetical protein